MGYLANFMVYTLAMVGVIVIALLVFKNATAVGCKNSSKILKVHDTLSLGPRKTLYIVSAGDEKFLIAGDVDKTSLISKLEIKESKVENSCISAKSFENNDFKSTMENLHSKSSYIDRKNLGIYSIQEKPYGSVMKNLAERMREVTK